MELRKYIREMVETELDEMARISTNIKIGDPEKAAIAKELYDGTWYGDMIDYVEEAGATGIPQPELARMLGKSGQQAINPKVRDFLESGIFTKGELSVPKKEKPESMGAQGRPTSEKTLMARDINSKMEADANYKPSEDELATLGAEFIERIRMRVKGTLRRGRPAMPSKAKDGMMAAMKRIGDEDKDMDGDIDDEDLDLDDIAESTYINESFLRMQKLAGVITETQYNQKKNLIKNQVNESKFVELIKKVFSKPANVSKPEEKSIANEIPQQAAQQASNIEFEIEQQLKKKNKEEALDKLNQELEKNQNLQSLMVKYLDAELKQGIMHYNEEQTNGQSLYQPTPEFTAASNALWNYAKTRGLDTEILKTISTSSIQGGLEKALKAKKSKSNTY